MYNASFCLHPIDNSCECAALWDLWAWCSLHVPKKFWFPASIVLVHLPIFSYMETRLYGSSVSSLFLDIGARQPSLVTHDCEFGGAPGLWRATALSSCSRGRVPPAKRERERGRHTPAVDLKRTVFFFCKKKKEYWYGPTLPTMSKNLTLAT